MLDKIASHLHRSWPLRHAFFVFCALLSILVVGYYYGTFDQEFHIPFLLKFINPALYPGDPFLDLRFTHYSYFWYLFAPFYKLNILEPVMFLVHVLATYGTFWMIWELSETLFKNQVSNLLITITFIFPHIAMSGFQVIEYSLLNRSFVLPFLLLAVVLHLKSRSLLSWLILGVMYNFHLLSVNFILMMILVDSLLRFQEFGWKKLASGIFIFILAAMPVLLWKASSPELDLTIRPDLLSLAITHGPLFPVYYWISSSAESWGPTLSGVISVLFFTIALKNKVVTREDRIMTHFMIAMGIIIFVETLNTYLFPVTLILQLQLLRVGVFLLIFGYMYFANYLAHEIEKIKNNLTSGVLIISFITFISPVLTMVFWCFRKWSARIRWRRVLMGGFLITSQSIFVIFALSFRIWAPGIHIFPEPSPWLEVQEWAKTNTAVDARFITPPQYYWPYTLGWRVVSQRSTLVTYLEIEDLIFNPEDLQSFEQRYNAIAPGALAKFDGFINHDLQTTGDAFYNMTPDEFIKVSKQYNISYLVVQKPYSYPFPVLYENKGFIVYDLESYSSEPQLTGKSLFRPLATML